MPYRAGADLLHRQGQEVAPLPKEKAAGADWRERGLARYLLFRLSEPEKVAARSRLFGHGTPAPAFAPNGSAAAGKAGKVPLRDGRGVMDGRAVPLPLDHQRAGAEDVRHGSAALVVWDRQGGDAGQRQSHYVAVLAGLAESLTRLDPRPRTPCSPAGCSRPGNAPWPGSWPPG